MVVLEELIYSVSFLKVLRPEVLRDSVVSVAEIFKNCIAF